VEVEVLIMVQHLKKMEILEDQEEVLSILVVVQQVVLEV
jgi:hypothetical protein